jgi:hypothetical protein
LPVAHRPLSSNGCRGCARTTGRAARCRARVEARTGPPGAGR